MRAERWLLLRWCVGMLGCGLLACAACAGEEVGEIFDNTKLVSMLKAKIALSVIKKKIENSTVRFNSDADQLIQVRSAAAEGGMEEKDIVELLNTVIDKANLEKVRVKELVDRFMNICVNGDPPEYDSLMRQILSEGRVCVPQLLKHREEENELKRKGVLDALGRLGDKSATVLNQVRLMLSDRHPNVRKQAAKAVALLAAATTVDELIEILQKRQMDFVDGVALALGELGDPKAVGPLTTLLTLSTEREARWAAATALGQLRTKEKGAVEALLAAVLDQRDATLRAAAAEALGAIGEPRTVGYVIRGFQRYGEPESRAQLLKQLKYFKSYVALEFLVPISNDDSPEVRKAAVETLRVMTGANAENRDEWEAILNVMRDRPDWRDVDKAATVKPTQP